MIPVYQGNVQVRVHLHQMQLRTHKLCIITYDCKDNLGHHVTQHCCSGHHPQPVLMLACWVGWPTAGT